ncbi:MAG: HDOD domain-containing protein [Chlorobiota bacterium]
MSIFDKFLQKDNFISLPDIASKLLEILQQDDIDVNEIVRLIESDPVISMKTLKMANSPLFQVRSEVVNLSHAIQILGTKRVSDIVFSVSLHSKLFIGRNLNIYPLLEKYFYNSFLIGNLSKVFIDSFDSRLRNGLFVSGLLHDIGRMIMIQMEPLDYVKVIKLTELEDISEIEAENAVFREDHRSVGSKLSEVWSLPDMVHSVIKYYYTPETANNYQSLNFGINVSKNYVDKLTANDFKDVDNISIGNIKNFNNLSNMIGVRNISAFDEKMKELVKTLPDSYVLFK